MGLQPSDVERLLSASPARLPLTKSEFQAKPDDCGLRLQDAPTLFPAAQHSEAALAGLLLRLGCWTESHTLAQDVNTPEGSYWHAIVHRMEPDAANAGYWFDRTGNHPIFPELLARTAEILKRNGPANWQLKPTWDPFLFIRWCDEARQAGGQAEAAALEIQDAEWQLLFGWCSARKHSA